MGLNFSDPDYVEAFQRRTQAYRRLTENTASMPALRLHYRDNPADFINDWGMTINPKNIEKGRPSLVPFELYPKQREWVEWVFEHWKAGKPGLTEKTRQMGFSWLTMALSCTLCIFHDEMIIGIGSRKQEYIDIIGDPKSLIQKGREFMRNLPPEFLGGWNIKQHAPHMRIIFPGSRSILAGEAGDNIGRGNTTSLYFVDEAAFLERPQLVESSLSQTTNCRMDISTPNGMGNPFAHKRYGGKIDVFSFHWRDDPTKDDVWYAKQVEELDPVTIAQELDVDYAASVEGVLIPSAWVQSAIDAHITLGMNITGARSGALDVADEGKDLNAFAGAKGVLLEMLEEWSGKGEDIFGTVERAFSICDDHAYSEFDFDSDGLGVGVRGDARIINERRDGNGQRQISVSPFRGSEAVIDPKKEDVRGRKNEDYFANRKAQGGWRLRMRFQNTHRAVQRVRGVQVDAPAASHDEMISIPSGLALRLKLMMELSRPTYSLNGAGKIIIDKAPDGMKSPNLYDAVMIRFAGAKRMPITITPGGVHAMRSRARR